jgi:transcription initiation factor IIE alpha subunit
MIYKKLMGLFRCLPEESLTIERICSLTNSSQEEVNPILDKLRKDKIISGKRKMKLSGELKKHYLKHCKPPC